MNLISRLLRGVAAVSVLALAATVISAGAASAATVNGAATLSPALGGSTTNFSVVTPGGALCSGTFANGYQEVGFMTPTALPIQGQNLAGGPPIYSGGIPAVVLYASGGVNFGPGNNGPGSGGVLTASPNTLEFGQLGLTPAQLGLGAVGSVANFEVGTACVNINNGSIVTDNWQCPVTFTAVTAAVDAAGYTWTANCGGAGGPNVPEVPLTAALPIGAAAVFGGAVFINRRRRTTPVAAG